MLKYFNLANEEAEKRYIESQKENKGKFAIAEAACTNNKKSRIDESFGTHSKGLQQAAIMKVIMHDLIVNGSHVQTEVSSCKDILQEPDEEQRKAKLTDYYTEAMLFDSNKE